jgi:NAD-dependent SIR2 family protein deacetylase
METARKRKVSLKSSPPPSALPDAKEDGGSTVASSDDNDGSRVATRRRSRRGNEYGIERLASRIVRGDKVVFVTGAGLSAASGIRPFRRGGGGGDHPAASSHHISNHNQHSRRVRGDDDPPAGLWDSVVWTTATRECFRKDPLRWYNRFFLPHFFHAGPHRPSWGHRALDEMLEEFDSVRQVTQNIDGLQKPSPRLVEVHGRVGLYRCLNDEDDDSDWDESDQDEECDSKDESGDGSGERKSSTVDSDDPDREGGDDVKADGANEEGRGMQLTDAAPSRPRSFRVRLGHRAKSRRYQERGTQCRYQYRTPLEAGALNPPEVRRHLAVHQQERGRSPPPPQPSPPSAISIDTVPRCPSCDRAVMPLALMFDEGYHSHSFYRFETVEEWIQDASVLVFCGTSFSVRVTSVALQHAQKTRMEVFNFNTVDVLCASKQLDVTNIVGDVEATLPRLMRECRTLRERLEQNQARQVAVEQP